MLALELVWEPSRPQPCERCPARGPRSEPGPAASPGGPEPPGERGGGTLRTTREAPPRHSLASAGGGASKRVPKHGGRGRGPAPGYAECSRVSPHLSWGGPKWRRSARFWLRRFPPRPCLIGLCSSAKSVAKRQLEYANRAPFCVSAGARSWSLVF